MVAAHDAAVIICYVQGKNVREVGDFDLSADPIEMMREYFARQIEIAQRNGVEKILLDPGLGFYYRNLQDSAVRVRHQMNIFLNTFRLRTLGFPICHALPHAFEFFRDEVRCAEPFFAVLAALGKTDLFRTHEVPRIKAVLDTMRFFEPVRSEARHESGFADGQLHSPPATLAAKKHAFLLGFRNPLFADFQSVAGKSFANALRRVAIGKEKPDGFAGTKIKRLVFNFDPARTA